MNRFWKGCCLALALCTGLVAHFSPALAEGKLTSTQFTLDPSTFSPSEVKYEKGANEGSGQDGNVIELLRKIGQFLLIAVGTGAVLFIAYGGFLMAISGGDTDRSTKGRTIIMYNLQAVVIAMLSYGIIQFVIWIL